jgi:hypothetical protein
MPQVMLRYRAASFFSRMNCPEISMGIYTTDEIIDGDFKEYKYTDTQQEVENEIEQNAQSVEFVDAEIVEEIPGEQPLPDFMTAE